MAELLLSPENAHGIVAAPTWRRTACVDDHTRIGYHENAMPGPGRVLQHYTRADLPELSSEPSEYVYEHGATPGTTTERSRKRPAAVKEHRKIAAASDSK